MRHLSTAIALCALMLTVPQVIAAENCTDKRAIWANEMGDVRHIVYGTEGVNSFSKIHFEEWRGGKIAWRGGGEIACSNGASTCYGLIRNNLGDNAMTESVLEQIDADGDGVADWVIFAGLSQALWYNEGLKVEWFNGFAPEGPADRIQTSNIYRISGCRKTDALVLDPSNPPSDLGGSTP